MNKAEESSPCLCSCHDLDAIGVVYYHPGINRFYQHRGYRVDVVLIGVPTYYFADSLRGVEQLPVSNTFVSQSIPVFEIDKFEHAEWHMNGFRVKPGNEPPKGPPYPGDL